MPINQPKTPPILPTKKGQIINRTNILNGNILTYYGPGQKPDTGPCNGLDATAGYEPATLSYSPPTDWPISEQLLEMPQVVWLTLLMDGRPMPSFRNAEPAEFGFNVYVPIELFDPDIHPVPPSGGGNFIFRGGYLISNKERSEYERLTTVFSNVKTYIENLRQNRTWIKIPSWSVMGETDLGFWVQDTLPLLRAPNNNNYLGTNFLHIYCGNFVYDYEDPDPDNDIELRINWDPDNDPIASIYCINCLENLTTAKNLCPKYSIKVYDCSDLGWSPDGAYVDKVSAFYPDTDVGDIVEGFAPSSYADEYNRLLDIFNGEVTSMNGLVSALAGLGYDIESKGSLTNLNETILINLIAQHYNFNPTTGKDL